MVLWAALVLMTESGPYGCLIMKNNRSTLALKVSDNIAVVVVVVVVVVTVIYVTNISFDAFLTTKRPTDKSLSL